MGKIIDGKALSSKQRDKIAENASRFISKFGRAPSLAVILVGDNPASKVYVKNKRIACEKAGIKSFDYHLDKDISQTEVVSLIDTLNAKDDVDGILVQLPLPDHLNTQEILLRIDPSKDADGFHPYNLGRLLMGSPTIVSATPYGIMSMLKEYNVSIDGKDAIIIGRSNIVGKPMAILLMMAHATVTICHTHTKDLGAKVRSSDIVIAAAGSPHMIKGEWIKHGAVVIDVGITRLEDGSLSGDVEFDEAIKHASLITPVPGGVGPMTITMLLENTLKVANGRRS
ncbi:MAG: bifunctional methylenetetrahydrofolate dehydrogenase/methenyltetrahydrofolate cyclohydrolase FolD [Thermodesulfobacteriota bacterium]|nr:bifunctional methylenetetrahydrofolate dehydrogenase/methenyltetrahydrofolate cyclohydrolase FolD [Thermodesulfobacteriota bacterium]